MPVTTYALCLVGVIGAAGLTIGALAGLGQPVSVVFALLAALLIHRRTRRG